MPIKETHESREGKNLVAANGSDIKIYGEKRIPALTQSGRKTEMKYTIADVSMPLLSVSAICDQGKRVVFDNKGSYIQDKATGAWETINRVGNSYDFVTWIQVSEPSDLNPVAQTTKPERETNMERASERSTSSGFTRLGEMI